MFAPYPHSELKVYYNIHRYVDMITTQNSDQPLTPSSIRRLILAVIEDPYSTEQLREPRMNVLIVKPLVDRLYDEDDISIGRCSDVAMDAIAD